MNEHEAKGHWSKHWPMSLCSRGKMMKTLKDAFSRSTAIRAPADDGGGDGTQWMARGGKVIIITWTIGASVARRGRCLSARFCHMLVNKLKLSEVFPKRAPCLSVFFFFLFSSLFLFCLFSGEMAKKCVRNLTAFVGNKSGTPHCMEIYWQWQ